MPERVQMYGRWLTAPQKDERQDNGDKKRLASPPKQFTSLADSCMDRRSTARRRLASALSFAISMCSVWATWCRCVYLVKPVCYYKSTKNQYQVLQAMRSVSGTASYTHYTWTYDYHHSTKLYWKRHHLLLLALLLVLYTCNNTDGYKLVIFSI